MAILNNERDASDPDAASSMSCRPSPDLAARHVVVDEATTARIRGWALDPQAPHTSLRLQFLIDGVPAWQGACDAVRTDVRAAGHATDRVGFAFRPEIGTPGPHVLTVRDRNGERLAMLVGGQALLEVPLAAPVQSAPPPAIYSHIDSLRRGWIQGWVLRNVVTPEGAHLQGCCTVALAHEGHIVLQAVADLPRADVSAAMQADARCGFLIEIPRARLTLRRSPVFRLFVMPERQELTGSPCIVAPGGRHANG